uniref:rRNA adenine N(6)-methyltransferase n=1 Tax=Jaculus jaculus TaxID=51337 RepID=A0A8C5P2R1_JACJA
MWGRAAGLPPRLPVSLLAGPGRCCVLRAEAGTRKDLQARNRRGFSDYHPQHLPDLGFEDLTSWIPKGRSDPKRYVTSRHLANTVANIMQDKRQNRDQLLLEFNPGPGILTQALLETGVKVVALESDKAFIPHLESLRKIWNENLQVIHCDFFKLDPRNDDVVRPPVMLSHTLFQNLGIKPVHWTAGIPLKIIGVFPIKNERNALWKLLYDLYACTSIYRYGRVELNIFISEKEFQKLVATPKTPDLYQVLSVLWQVACEIKVLHVEPLSSFNTFTEYGQLSQPKHKEPLHPKGENLYFIRMTPHINLFTEHLSPINYDIFFHMVKHCFGKRNATLIHHLHSLSSVDTVDILKSMKEAKMKITQIHPRQFKRLFEIVECSKGYTYKWLYDDSLEDVTI